MDGKERRIRDLELFSGVKTKDIGWIATVADTVDLPAGAVLAKAGRPAREFAVILSGTAELDNGESLEAGAFFGHDALVDSEPNIHTITAAEPVRLLVFEARAFHGLIDKLPTVARKLMRELVTELRVVEARRVGRLHAPALSPRVAS